MKSTRRHHRRRGQTITEYVLIIAVVVVAAVGILSIFSDTVRSKIAGIINIFDPGNTAAQQEMQTTSRESMEELGSDQQPGN